MNSLLEHELDSFETVEAHWSTSTILAIFFASSLISALFFGLGYSFGLGKTAKPSYAAAISQPGRAADPVQSSVAAAAPAANRHAQQTADLAKPTAGKAVEPAAAASSPQYMVQMGAVGSHREAQRLISHLRRKGFQAGVYPGKHDRYLHVQMGPFASMEQAQSARRRVAAHGFHAIVKHAA